MARPTSSNRRTVARLVVASVLLALGAMALGFFLGLARPRKDAEGRPLPDWPD